MVFESFCRFTMVFESFTLKSNILYMIPQNLVGLFALITLLLKTGKSLLSRLLHENGRYLETTWLGDVAARQLLFKQRSYCSNSLTSVSPDQLGAACPGHLSGSACRCNSASLSKGTITVRRIAT
jgi:hypothetical protein